MFLLKPALFTLLFSLGGGVFLGFLLLKIVSKESFDGYFVIISHDSYAYVLEGDFLKETDLSESAQWVFLDDLGTLMSVPLIEYENRLLDIDPRRDSYAEKLRSFFVRDGRRFFFIEFKGERIGDFVGNLGGNLGETPFSDTSLNEKHFEGLKNRLKDGLGAGYSLYFFREGRPLIYYFKLFALGALGALVLSQSPFSTLLLLIIFAPLVFAGKGAFILISLLFAVYSVVFIMIDCFKRYSYGKKPLLSPCLACLLCLVALILWAFSLWDQSDIFSPQFKGTLGMAERDGFFAFLVLPSLFCVLFLAVFNSAHFFKGNFNRGKSNIGAMLPFALVSVISFYVETKNSFEYGAFSDFSFDFLSAVNENDYQEHFDFQSNFSFRSLLSERGESQDYMRYELGEDGLIANFEPHNYQKNMEIPPFPLKDLIAFFRTFEYSSKDSNNETNEDLADFVFIMTFVPIIATLALRYFLVFDERISA